MRIRILPAAMLLMLACGVTHQSGLAQNRGPSTAEERRKAVELTRMLETDPFHRDAKEARRWLTRWLIEVPDITVTVCTAFLEPLLKSKENYSTEIVTQMMFSSAAFIIEHPEKAGDERAVYLAGLEGSLRAYEAILKSKPRARWPFLDGLIEKRNEGGLGDYVGQTMVKCRT
jgi:hypothetical protein